MRNATHCIAQMLLLIPQYRKKKPFRESFEAACALGVGAANLLLPPRVFTIVAIIPLSPDGNLSGNCFYPSAPEWQKH